MKRIKGKNYIEKACTPFGNVQYRTRQLPPLTLLKGRFCSVRRQETNTPLQALVLMNDPTYVEASRVLGHKMLQYSDPKAGIEVIHSKN